MVSPRKSRSLAAAMVLMLAASACSSAELAGLDQLATGGEAAEGDGDGDGDEGGQTDDEGEGEGDGDGDDDETLPSHQDPVLAAAMCDPLADLTLTYDLAEAQAEVAPVLIRESVLNGTGKVPTIPLSVQPFLNRFAFSYPPADGEDPQISGELWKPPVVNINAPDRYRLQYAIRGPKVLANQRGPIDLAIVVDLGPSMAGEPLAIAEETLAVLEAALMPGDRVTLIAAAEQPTILGSTTIVEGFGTTPLTGLLSEDALASSTDLAAALQYAYGIVSDGWDDQGQPRVLLVSNGHFKADEMLVALVEDNAVDGRYLVSLGVGDPELFADAPLRELAAEGRGPLLYARSSAELWHHFYERFAAHMLAAAAEIEVKLTLPAGLAIRQRDQFAPESDEPERAVLGFNDTIVFHHELETCGELEAGALILVELEWVDVIANEVKHAVWELGLDALGDGSFDIRKGAATVAYARALRGYRDGKPASESFGAVLDAISLIAEALDGMPEDADLLEMTHVLGKLEG
jgi:hypothetical protein